MAITYKGGPKDGQVEYVGCTLTNRYDIYMGFDVYADYADIFDGEKVVKISVGSGYCGMTDYTAMAVKDATPEIEALAKAWREEQYRKVCQRRLAESTIKEANRVKRDDTIEVVRGRKHPIGTKGKVFWVGDTRYGKSIGFKIEGSETALWVAYGNVEKVLTSEQEEEVKEAEEILAERELCLA